MQGYNPAAAFLPGARPLHQSNKSKRPGPWQGASAESGAQARVSGGSSFPGRGPSFAPSHQEQRQVHQSNGLQQQHHSQSPHSMAMMAQRPPAFVPGSMGEAPPPPPHFYNQFLPPSRPHVPFMHPTISSGPAMSAYASTGNPRQQQQQHQPHLLPRPQHSPRPSLSMSIPSNPNSQPRLSPKLHSPSESKPASAYSPLGLPLKRQVPVKMPPHRLWTREPLSAEESQAVADAMQETADDVLLLEPTSRNQHEDEVRSDGLPASIEIYLPGALAWVELLEQLIQERPLGTPIPSDLLAFKLNCLRGSPVTLASGTGGISPILSPSPKPPFAPSGCASVSSIHASPSPSPAPDQPKANPSLPALSVTAPEFKPKLNPEAFTFVPPTLKPTAPVFTPRAQPPPAPPAIVEECVDEDEDEPNMEQQQDQDGEEEDQHFAYQPMQHPQEYDQDAASESATNPSDEEQSEVEEASSTLESDLEGEESNDDDEPLAQLAARQRHSLSDPAALLLPSSAASKSSFSTSSNPSDDENRTSHDEGPMADGGHTSHSSRASEAIRRAVSNHQNHQRRSSDQPPDPDPWLEGKEEILAVHPPTLRSTFPGSKLSVDASEFRPAATPLPPSAFECSESSSESEGHQWFEPHHSTNNSSQQVVLEQQEGKDNMRSFRFPRSPTESQDVPLILKDSALQRSASHAQQEQYHSRQGSGASERPAYRGHTVQPSGLAKSLAADPQGTAYLPRNSPESRQINNARAGPLPSLFEGEAPYHERLMSYGDDISLPDARRGQHSISHAVPLSSLVHLGRDSVGGGGSHSRTHTSTSFETDPSNFNEEPQMPASWKSFEILLEGKLNDLRQDLTGFSTLKADLESLKRDALVDALIGQLDRKLAEWTVDLGLSGRSSLDDGSIRHIAAMLEETSRRTLDHVVASMGVPQLQATITEEDKESLVSAIVAASNSSSFSPLVHLQGVVEQLRGTSADAATQLVELKQLVSGPLGKGQDPLDVASLVGVLVEEVRTAQMEQLESKLSPLVESVKETHSSRSFASAALEQLQDECRQIKDQFAASNESDRLQSLIAQAIKAVLPDALTDQREQSELRLREILNSVLSAIASSEQDSKMTHNSMSRFNDQLSEGIEELRELVRAQRDHPRPKDAERLAQLEISNETLSKSLKSSQSAVQEQEYISERQAKEMDHLRRRVQELEHDNRVKDAEMDRMKTHESDQAQEREALWEKQMSLIQSRLKEQDERVASLSRELGRSEGLQERLQSALESDTQARQELSEVEADLVDMKIASAKEATEASNKLDAAHQRITQLEADLERSRTAQAAARDMYRTGSSSTSEFRGTPQLEQSGFMDDVVYGGPEEEDGQHYETLIRQQGTTTSRHNLRHHTNNQHLDQKHKTLMLHESTLPLTPSRAASPAVSVLHVPRPADDGWWS